jgi:hypothetical protein
MEVTSVLGVGIGVPTIQSFSEVCASTSTPFSEMLEKYAKSNEGHNKNEIKRL